MKRISNESVWGARTYEGSKIALKMNLQKLVCLFIYYDIIHKKSFKKVIYNPIINDLMHIHLGGWTNNSP